MEHTAARRSRLPLSIRLSQVTVTTLSAMFRSVGERDNFAMQANGSYA